MLTLSTHTMTVKEPKGGKIATPSAVYDVLQDASQMAQEAFIVLTLDSKNKMIDRHLVTLGLLDASLVHPREVFRVGILDGAAAIILAHNHPSGDPMPSAEDIRITRQLVEAGKVVDIKVLDHIILGRGEKPFLSMREDGLVEF